MADSTSEQVNFTPADNAAAALEENMAAINLLVQSAQAAFFANSKLDLRGLEFVLLAIQRKNDEIRALLAQA
jgi:hypothetical protein